MLRGPEAYLQMWERSVGIPAARCKSAAGRFTRRGLGSLRLGLGIRGLLERAGQPLTRERAWSWCVEGKRGRNAAQTAVMTEAGKVGLVASSARRQRAKGVGPGTPVKRLRGRAKRRGGSLWTARLGKRTIAYVVSDHEVRTVAIAARKVGRKRASLRRYLRLVPRDGVAPRPPNVVSRASSRIDPERAVPLVAEDGSSPFPFTCGL
jgi:hypothetical protein